LQFFFKSLTVPETEVAIYPDCFYDEQKNQYNWDTNVFPFGIDLHVPTSCWYQQHTMSQHTIRGSHGVNDMCEEESFRCKLSCYNRSCYAAPGFGVEATTGPTDTRVTEKGALLISISIAFVIIFILIFFFTFKRRHFNQPSGLFRLLTVTITSQDNKENPCFGKQINQ